MTKRRWRSPRVSAGAAVLLLPTIPAVARVQTQAGRWTNALEAAGVRVESTASRAQLLVAEPDVAAASGVDVVLVPGRDRRRRLVAAGYAVQTYVARRAPGGALLLEPAEKRPFRTIHHRRTGKQLLVAALDTASGMDHITIGSRGEVLPWVVPHALASRGGRVSVIAGGGGPRRRSVLLWTSDGGDRPRAVVKVGARSAAERGVREQQALRRLVELGMGSRVPHPRGEGTLSALSWSAESAVWGHPLSDVAKDSGPGSTRASHSLLEALVDWFGELGAATRVVSSWPMASGSLPLRGEHRSLEQVRAGLHGVPGVFVHGDVGSGLNVLVDGPDFSVIDWETSREGELPLTDVLPLVCLRLAAHHGHHEPHAIAEYVLRLCAGREPDSLWLFALLLRYCARVGVPPSQAGRLAVLSWGYLASMRVVHDELVAAAGDAVTSWVSPADEIARRWPKEPGLGLSWTALSGDGG